MFRVGDIVTHKNYIGFVFRIVSFDDDGEFCHCQNYLEKEDNFLYNQRVSLLEHFCKKKIAIIKMFKNYV